MTKDKPPLTPRRVAQEVLLNLLPRERIIPITDGDDNGEDDNPCRPGDSRVGYVYLFSFPPKPSEA